MQTDPLIQRLTFLSEIDRLKSVIRQSPILDQSRKENSAEHSWHVAMFALLLQDCASSSVNIERVIKMLLIHDVVEVDVGDTPIHGGSSPDEQHYLETQAANRLFGLLPKEQGAELLALWHEFEEAESEDALFAKALDRVQPLVANVSTGGGTWTESNVTLEQVLQRYGPTIERGSSALWSVCKQLSEEHFAISKHPTTTTTSTSMK